MTHESILRGQGLKKVKASSSLGEKDSWKMELHFPPGIKSLKRLQDLTKKLHLTNSHRLVITASVFHSVGDSGSA